MKSNLSEIGQELKSILTGKTLDALILPLVFALTNAAFGLTVGAITALGLSLVLGVLRIIKNNPGDIPWPGWCWLALLSA